MKTFEGKRIFISGGNGVIGNALVEKLQAQGAILYVGDLKPRPQQWAKTIIYRQGDLNFITQAELMEFKPEVFFHLAATFERSVESYEFWQENFHHNVKLSNHLMSLLKDCDSLKKVIFASSYLIYDPQLYSFPQPAEKAYRLPENAPIYPRNLTGVAKLNHEIELRFISEFNKLQAISARIYRSYGKNSRDIISRWIRALLNHEVLTVYAKEGLFDYIYAEEVAEGLLRLAAHPSIQGVVNLGNDNARRVTEVLTILKQHFPSLQTVEIASNIPYEASQANMEFCQQLLSWQPKRQLEDTIPELIAYEKAHPWQESSLSFNVLVTSISRKVPLLKAVQHACEKLHPHIKLYGGDVNPNCLGKHFVTEFWHMPPLTELTSKALLEFCQKHHIRCIIPTRDGELAFFAKLKSQLAAQHIQVMVADSDKITACLDKLLFCQNFHNLGFPIIPTTDNINTLHCNRFVVKERYGAGSVNLGLNLNKSLALEQAKNLENPIFQPFIVGEEVSVDVYIANNGQAKGAIARKRNIVVHGESQVTTTFRNVALEHLCIRLANAMQLYGHVIFQIIIDKEGKFHVIECNGRFGGASTLSLATGLDSFYWFLLESNAVDITEYPFLRSEQEKMQVRFPEDKIIAVL